MGGACGVAARMHRAIRRLIMNCLMRARLVALNRLIAQRRITERDDVLCILNVLCAQEADRCFHATPGREALLHG
jgi:hypothetical protein